MDIEHQGAEPARTLPGIGRHKQGCQTLWAATCRVAIECEHGYDVCPICDRCTCAGNAARRANGSA